MLDNAPQTPRYGAVTCRPPASALLSVALLCAVVASPRSAAAAYDPNPPTTAQLIVPGQEARVLGLLAPWQEGHEVAPGWRWTGTRIEKVRVCYVLSAAKPTTPGGATQKTDLCLLAPDAASAWQPQPRSQTRELVGGPLLVSRAAPGTRPPQQRLLAAFSERINANRHKAGLLQLWTRLSPLARHPHRAGTIDPFLGLLALGLWLLFAAARALRPMPGGGWPWALLLLTLSAALRFGVAVQAPMTAWAFSRITKITTVAQGSTLLEALVTELGGVYMDDLQTLLLRVISTLTPLAILGHSRYLFKDAKPALVAALLLAASPHHLRFSAADVEFIPSMLWSSASFLALYQALEAKGAVLRGVHTLWFAGLMYLCLTARPLSIVYAPLMLMALYFAAQDTSTRWRATLAAVITGVGAAALYRLIVQNGETIVSVANTGMLSGAWQLLTTPDYNPLLFFALTPPVWLLFMMAGAVGMVVLTLPSLSPKVSRQRGWWLLAWLFGFVVLHGVVVVKEALNGARYQLHSLPAMAMLAGVGVTVLWAHLKTRLWRAWLVGALALALVAPALHAEVIQDRSFMVMREWAFLQRVRTLVPRNCQIIEVQAAVNPSPDSRVAKVAMRLGGTKRGWQHVLLRDPLSAAQRRVLDAAPRCQVFYEGATCAKGPHVPGRRALCDAVLGAGEWEVVAETRFAARIYDEGLSGALRGAGDPVRLRLWRRVGRGR